MVETAETLDPVIADFDQGLERYKKGEDPLILIPVFKDICDRAPKNATVWACLAWLYLITDKPKSALKAAQNSVKIDAKHPQAQVNLALAMLENKRSGVRDHIELASQIMSLDKEIYETVAENIEDGLERKPDWQNLQRVKAWLIT
ncbi:MAG: tetratricopeptide repeat protein [Microcystaceae cyanobacterium]